MTEHATEYRYIQREMTVFAINLECRTVEIAYLISSYIVTFFKIKNYRKLTNWPKITSSQSTILTYFDMYN